MGQLKLMILKWLSSSQICLCLRLPVTPQPALFVRRVRGEASENVPRGALSRDSAVHYVITDNVAVNNGAGVTFERCVTTS